MITHPNCKINLGLHVVRRRADGYHDLETLFVPIPLCDELEIREDDHFSFILEGIPIDGDTEQNLVVKAYRLMQRHYPQIGQVAIRLQKNIPFGAGMGGGSADAAFCLTMLNQIFSLRASYEELERLAAQLGADCAFFVRNRAAYAEGIGDKLQAVDLDLTDYHIVVVKPQDSVSTREAYSGIVPNAVGRPDLREVIRRPIAEWRDLIVNDFEQSVFPTHPRIAELKERLYANGALYASMTGSGAALFALFDKDDTEVLRGIADHEIVLP